MANGVYVIPMPVLINGKEYYEDINLTRRDFFRAQRDNASITTSQPSVSSLTEVWNKLLRVHDELVYIPMSGALSSSCSNASVIAAEFNGRVHVVNDLRISATQYQSVMNAVAMRSAGKSAAQIKARLEATAYDASIYIMVDSLEYLKRGGRITPAAEKIGSLMRVKPILQIMGGKLDACAVKRGVHSARKKMIELMRNDLENKFAEEEKAGMIQMFIAYTESDPQVLESWVSEVRETFERSVIVMPLSLSIAGHTGPGCLGIGCARIIGE